MKMLCDIVDGRLNLEDRDRFKNGLSLLSGKYVLELYPYKKPVSSDAIRYYRGVVIKMIWEELKVRGETISEDEVHMMLKMKYLAQAGDLDDGRLPHINELTQEKMSWYIEMCQQWASRVLHIYIPDPNE